METVAIVGANFAGLNAARQLEKHCKVKVIDCSENFIWTPNIHEILSGLKGPEKTMLHRRKLLTRMGHEFIQSRVEAIDINKQVLALAGHDQLEYDYCLLATGLVGNTYGIPGVDQYAMGFRSSDEALRIRSSIQQLISRGKPFTITVIGGGFSGVEVLGELLRSHRDKINCRIRVLETNKQLLPGLPKVVSEDICRLCQTLNVDIRFDTRIKEISANSVVLDTGEELMSDLSIWTAGTRVPDYIRESALTSNDQGMVKVNEKLQANASGRVFIAGDLTGFSPVLAKQASHALDMGLIAGRNINNAINNKPLQPFIPAEKPIALAFGDLNTYIIHQNTVVASPFLALAKEAVYQLYMTQLSSSLPFGTFKHAFFERAVSGVKQQLLPQLAHLNFIKAMRQAEILQWGGAGDLLTLASAFLISATR